MEPITARRRKESLVSLQAFPIQHNRLIQEREREEESEIFHSIDRTSKFPMEGRYFKIYEVINPQNESDLSHVKLSRNMKLIIINMLSFIIIEVKDKHTHKTEEMKRLFANSKPSVYSFS